MIISGAMASERSREFKRRAEEIDTRDLSAIDTLAAHLVALVEVYGDAVRDEMAKEAA
jgi:hypothetical protein